MANTAAQSARKICEICMRAPGLEYCKQCYQVFCDDCKISHLRSKISKNHTFMSGPNINTEKKVGGCKDHNEDFVYLCGDCDQLICRLCVTKAHQQHYLVDIKDSNNKMQTEISKYLDSMVDNIRPSAKLIEGKAKTYKTEVEATMQGIIEQGNIIKAMVDKKVDALIKALRERERIELQSLSKANKDCTDLLGEATRHQHIYQDMIKQCDEVALFHKMKKIKSDIENLKSVDVTNLPSATYNRKHVNLSDVDQLFGNLNFQETEVTVKKTKLSAELHDQDKQPKQEMKEDQSPISNFPEFLLAGQNREHIDTEHQYRSDIDRYRQERNRACSKLNILQEQMKNKTAKLKKQETLYHEDRKQLENRIQDLEDQISDRLGKLSQQEQLDPVREELSVMKIKLSSLEDELKINKDRKYVLEKENEEISKKYQDVLRKLRESESRYSSQSDIEKENESLKHELTMSLMNIEKIKQEYKDLEKRRDTEMTRNKETTYRLQNDLDRLKSQQDLQKQTSRGELNSLKEQRAKLERDKQILREKIYSLENEKIGLEERINQAELILQNQQTLRKENSELKESLESMKKEMENMEEKLSEAAGNKLRENNPNIPELGDINRPTALADKFNSLYTDEYNDAMEVIESSMDEASAVHVMLECLKCCYNWCERLAREQRDLLTSQSIGFMNKYQGQKINYVVSDNCLIHVKEFQKKIAVDTLTAVRKICHVKSVTQENLIHNNYIMKYIQRCSELCWMMQITDPPLCLKFDVKNNEDHDKTLYNAFTKNGSKIEYLVWPILFLHKSGPMLAKGVAQGT